MRTHPQLWPVYQDTHRQQRLAQPASRPQVADPVRAAALAPLVNLQLAVVAATAVDMATAVDRATAVETATEVDMDLAPPEAETVAVAAMVALRLGQALLRSASVVRAPAGGMVMWSL